MNDLSSGTTYRSSSFVFDEKEELSNDDLLFSRFFPWYVKYITNIINLCSYYSKKSSCKLAMRLLSVGVRKKMKAEDQLFYKKGKKEFYRSVGKKFYVYTYGEGPEVICVHGWCSNAALWRKHVERLVEKGFKAVVIDAPGHGTSPGFFLSIKDYISILENVFKSRENIHGIMCHSIGALCGVIALSRSKPSKTYKVVIMASFNSCEELLSKFSRCLGFRKQLIKNIMEWIPEYAGNPLSYYSVVNHLPNIKGKVLLVHDKDDFVVPFNEVNIMLRNNKDIKYYPTKNLGHLLRGEEIEELTTNFVTA